MISKISAMILLVSLTACTVTPQPVKSAAPSFDGNVRNSGVISATPAGYIITASALQRYVALAKIYAGQIHQSILGGEGCTANTDGTFTMDRQHMVYFIEMSQWARMGRAP